MDWMSGMEWTVGCTVGGTIVHCVLGSFVHFYSFRCQKSLDPLSQVWLLAMECFHGKMEFLSCQNSHAFWDDLLLSNYKQLLLMDY